MMSHAMEGQLIRILNNILSMARPDFGPLILSGLVEAAILSSNTNRGLAVHSFRRALQDAYYMSVIIIIGYGTVIIYACQAFRRAHK